MLKDILKNGFYYLVDSRKNHDKMYSMRGEVEIFGRKNGKLFYHDKGPNTVTMWAKHSMMHVLSGESFSATGQQRSKSSADHYTAAFAGDSAFNKDGTLLSNEQFFSSVKFPGTLGWWSKGDSNIPSAANYIYPYFPTKILFGTGYEYASYAAMPADFQTYYPTGTWSAAWAQVANADNNYSNTFGGATGDSLYKMKTMNDIYSTTLVTPTIVDSDFGVPGAVKTGLYESLKGDSGKLESISGNYFLQKAYQGVGLPAFIYCKRESRFYQSGTEVALDYDASVENKITFTVTMPEQTGTNAGIFYPYNGNVLKVAGLFCDARFILRNDIPSDDAHSDDSALQEYKNYLKMPYGIMMAKRYISPITKSHDVSITARWTLYL
jgi:hypothetical protein